MNSESKKRSKLQINFIVDASDSKKIFSCTRKCSVFHSALRGPEFPLTPRLVFDIASVLDAVISSRCKMSLFCNKNRIQGANTASLSPK